MGALLILAAGCGVYLLATDNSLWLLALSHAVGLVIIVGIDLTLGLLNLTGSRRAYLPTMAAAFLAIVLQAGDVLSAPQYNQSIAHFASYLFSLWAFDLLLVVQGIVLLLGLLGRPYARYLAARRSRRGKELDYSRRGFLRSVVSFTGLVGLAVILSSIKLPVASQSQSSSTTVVGGPTGAIARVSSMTVGTPVYFEYPAGYPNMLMLASDGTLSAVSLLCTHVCCECEYVPSQSVLACPCHGSVFDTTGKVLQGPALEDLPQVTLMTDRNGYVVPIGVSSTGPCTV
jgi:cytochrome b6-f complex iron-sulfur subunit